MKISLCILFFCLFSLSSLAQQSRVFGSASSVGRILSLRTEIGGRQYAVPVLRLGNANDMVAISFDELSHEYHRFEYSVQHCDVHWQPSEDLFYSEFAESTQERIPIEEYVESQNVTTHYTHYSFTFPSADLRPLLSGNYKILIYCDDAETDEAIAEVCVRVVEPKVSISGTVTTNTEIDLNESHQQIEYSVDCERLQAKDLREEIYCEIMQNERIDNAKINPRSSYQNGTKLIWQHNRNLIFPAGNEYRKYEILSARYPGLHTESIRFHEPYLHATIATDEMRKNYLLTEDQNGISVIRNTDNFSDESETEYMITHFSLFSSEPLEDADVYINGKWTTGGICKEWKLQYDEDSKCYVGAFMLKQGYYNYQYLVVERLGKHAATFTGKTYPFEGDFYQTSNDYQIFVYFLKPGSRYHQLVGVANIK